MKKFWKYCIYLSLLLLSSFTATYADEEKKLGAYYGAKTAEHPDWFKESFLDLEDDVADAATNKKRLVLYFWQPGCPYCSQLWEENFSKQEIVKKFRSNFEIIALNMWGDREVVSVAGHDYTEKSFADALRIKYTPTLLFFNENKKVVHQLNGYVPPDEFVQSMDYVSGKNEQKYSYGKFASVQQESKQKAVNLLANHELYKEDFFSKTGFDLNRSQIKKDKYLAVFFEGKNCKNCSLLHEKTLQDKTTRDLAKKFESIQLDRFADTPLTTPDGKSSTAENWADQLGISYLPAMVFFDEKGQEVMRIDTQMRTFHIQSVFDYVLSGAYKTELNFLRYISARADIIREQGIDVDIFAY